MAQDANHLVWLDMEMTGLDPERERIIELAMIVTDSNLNTVAESPVWVVHQSDAQLDAMDDWNKKHARQIRLDRAGRASTLDEAAVEAAALALCRNTSQAHQPDVRQLDRAGPALHGALHAPAGGLVSLPQP
jgi:oligoribonuclease (3'-5' exoribonuclease)